MANRRILSVGFQLASSDVTFTALDGRTSLLDWDIVLFRPTFDDIGYVSDNYLGKPSLSDDQSFRLKDSFNHWRREIVSAYESGKTVVIFLPELEEVYVATGEMQYSGTGRNRHATRIVTKLSNYNAIPVDLTPVSATGQSMKLAQKQSDLLSAYWSEFAQQSTYKVHLTSPKVTGAILTRTGDKPVGTILRKVAANGHLLLLPDLDFFPDHFYKKVDGKSTFTGPAKQFSQKLISAIVALDKTLRSPKDVTPTPTWATDKKFEMPQEAVLRRELLDAESEIDRAQARASKKRDELHKAGEFRALLFEKGKALESSIISALQLIGFVAAPFQSADSEFDAVFESVEGRFIGEAEGKDDRSVNIDKLRQLSMNIHEDMSRDTVSQPAKAVLFGNGFRLQPLEKRGDPFTDKCKSAAAAASTALVFTPDLFPVVKYLIGNADERYAAECRERLLCSVGRVQFPPVPDLVVVEEKDSKDYK